eukprot:11523798-Alexandrium_andersonii.AAC.1
MAAPTTTDWAALVKLIRYLVVRPRTAEPLLRAYVDTDFAGSALEVYADSSVAIGICRRTGIGR